MKKTRLLIALSAACAISALIVTTISTKQFNWEVAAILMVLIAAGAASIAVFVQVRAERRHRWALMKRVCELEEALSFQQNHSIPPSASTGPNERNSFNDEAADTYSKFAEIHDRIHALEYGLDRR